MPKTKLHGLCLLRHPNLVDDLSVTGIRLRDPQRQIVLLFGVDNTGKNDRILIDIYMRNVEAEAAFQFVCDYLRKWGVDLIPLWKGGKLIEALPLPSRVDYALRRIGGLWRLNQMTAESRPFMQRDFIEAYNQAPLAESLASRLQEMFGERKLLGEVKLLTGVAMDSPGPETDQARTPPRLKTPRPRSIPGAMTQAEVRDRREMLRQQAEVLAAKRPVSETREVCPSVVLR